MISTSSIFFTMPVVLNAEEYFIQINKTLLIINPIFCIKEFLKNNFHWRNFVIQRKLINSWKHCLIWVWIMWWLENRLQCGCLMAPFCLKIRCLSAKITFLFSNLVRSYLNSLLVYHNLAAMKIYFGNPGNSGHRNCQHTHEYPFLYLWLLVLCKKNILFWNLSK